MRWSVTQGDCLEMLKSLPSGSVDAVITDPPYATTHCEWDKWAMSSEWWCEIWRATKPESAVVISICGKALVRLLSEAGQWYRYKTVWDRVGNAAVMNGRNFIGYEIDPKYCEIARRRIEAAIPLQLQEAN